ncbi:RTA1 domain protein [Aspergillus luchuensis]|uniref:RTA1 domain protein n=1 Tax=Aspergillus kawachii TaxID=1069201 RepID=A0A146FB34_ASPKA|nr:RTA1 domain protein [Aspergillus luchuensis]
MSASGHGSSETQKYGSDTCHAYVDGVSTSYGYVPSLAAASTFVALFGASMLGHAIQMSKFSDGQPEFGLLNVPMLRHHISCKLPPLS